MSAPDPKPSRSVASPLKTVAWVAAGYTFELLWVFRQVWWGGAKGHRFFGWDCLREYWPDMVFGLHAIQEGELPLWNPWSLGGYSYFGDIQAGMLSPVNWLLWGTAVLVGSDGPWLIQAKVMLNLGLGLTGMHLLLYRLTRSHVAGIIAASAYVFGSPLLVHKNGAFLWPLLYLPWAILALEHYLEAPTVRRGILVGAALWLCGSAGHPQGFFYALVVFGPYWIFRTLSPLRDVAHSLRRQWRGALAATVTGLLLLLPIYLPTAQAVARSPRADRTLQWVLQLPIPPKAMRELVLPNLDNNWMLDIYVGAVTLVLAAFAVVAVRRGTELKHRLFWLAMAVFGLALAMGAHTPVLPWLAQNVPGFDLFRIAYRHKLIFGFAVALLAGLGVSTLVRARWPGWSRWALLGFACLWILVAAGAHLGWWWSVRPGKPAAAVSATLWWAVPALASLVAATWDRKRAHLWSAAAALLLLLDLLQAGELKLNIMQPPPRPRRDQVVLKPLDGNRDQWRYFNDRLLPHYAPYLHDVREFSGFSNPVQLKRHLEVMKRARHNPVLLGRFNVRWLLSRRRPPRGLKKLAPHVYEIPNPTPLIQVYPRARRLPKKHILQRLASRRPLKLALVDPADRPPPLPEGQGEPVAGRVVHFSRNRLVLEVTSPWPAIAVINEAYYPGWQATVNGRRAKLFRANYLMRAVVVPAGKSRIELVFCPRWYYGLLVGFFLALLGLALALSGRLRWLDTPAGLAPGPGDHTGEASPPETDPEQTTAPPPTDGSPP